MQSPACKQSDPAFLHGSESLQFVYVLLTALFTGVFEAATIHYAVAKIFGPLIFGRGWCGYACWTAMVLDFLPYKKPQGERKKLGFF